MSDLGDIAARVAGLAGGGRRVIVAVAGPPGAGKSTVAGQLLASLDVPAHPAVLVPMDGFHLDNAVLDARGLRARKGAPETFDAAGFVHALERIRAGGEEVLVPAFDRARDLARAGAIVVAKHHRIVLSEGNYLLMRTPPWSALRPLFDLSVYLDVAGDELERRLVRRWLDHGLAPEQALARARANDLANARTVIEHSTTADLRLDN